jgi:queuine/archaeosine tRNA-ribosyltransferase
MIETAHRIRKSILEGAFAEEKKAFFEAYSA